MVMSKDILVVEVRIENSPAKKPYERYLPTSS